MNLEERDKKLRLLNQKIEKAKAEIERQKALIKDYEDEIINIQQQ